MDYQNTIKINNSSGTEIAELTIPEDWQRGIKPSRPGYLWISKFFTSPRNENVGICLREPAKKTYHYLSAQENPLLQILRRPPHELNEEEFLSIHLLLEQVGWPGRFKRDWAKTVKSQQSNVLVVQGQWVQENVKSRCMIIDTTIDTGNFAQEAWFVAPPEVFEEFAPEADRIFESLTWKLPVQA